MARVIVTLSNAEREALVKLSSIEYRDPRAQAALIIREALERRGLLPRVKDEAHDTSTESENTALCGES